MVKTKNNSGLSLWSTQIRSRWREDYWTFLAIVLLPFAFFIPRHLLESGHHPPVGTYIAVLGGLAAAVTFRKDPPAKEKALWIVLISFLMVAEIRNLYVADKEQSATSNTILGGLQEAKVGLDQTVGDLQAVGKKLEGVSSDVNKGVASSNRAADAARDAENSITGGDSFCYFRLIPVENGWGVQVIRAGKYPIWNAYATLQDEGRFRNMFLEQQQRDNQSGNFDIDARLKEASQMEGATTSNVIIGDLATDSRSLQGAMTLADSEGKGSAYAAFHARNGDWFEEIRIRRIADKWFEAIQVKLTSGQVFEKIDSGYPLTDGYAFDKPQGGKAQPIKPLP